MDTVAANSNSTTARERETIPAPHIPESTIVLAERVAWLSSEAMEALAPMTDAPGLGELASFIFERLTEIRERAQGVLR